jgi:hypothetical protein
MVSASFGVFLVAVSSQFLDIIVNSLVANLAALATNTFKVFLKELYVFWPVIDI